MKYAFKQKYFINIKYNTFKELPDFLSVLGSTSAALSFTSAAAGVAAFHQFQISENRETEIIYYLDGWVDVDVCWMGGSNNLSIHLSTALAITSAIYLANH